MSIQVFVKSDFSSDCINKLLLKYSVLPQEIASISPSKNIYDLLNNVDYLQKIMISNPKLIIIKDAHLIFPKADFNLQVIVRFLSLEIDLWLLVPSLDLLNHQIIECISTVEELKTDRHAAFSYSNALSWVSEDLAAEIGRGKGIIFWGASGVGKSTMAKQLAQNMKATIFQARCFDLVHGGVGDSEKELANLFKMAIDAQPSVILLDDMDTLFRPRGVSGDLAIKMVAQLIMELDEIEFYQHVVLFFGTAIDFNDLDESLWHGGRLSLFHIKDQNN